MICKFCQKEIDIAKKYKNSNQSISYYLCEPCQTEYTIWDGDQSNASYCIYTTINNITYRWSVLMYNKAILYKVKTGSFMFLKDIKGTDLIVLKRFENTPEIMTPSNINKKLQTLLTFL